MHRQACWRNWRTINKILTVSLFFLAMLSCSSSQTFIYQFDNGLVSVKFPGREKDLRYLPNNVYLGGGIHTKKPMFIVYRNNIMYGVEMLTLPKNWKTQKAKDHFIAKQQRKIEQSGDFTELKQVHIAGMDIWIKNGNFKGNNAYLLSLKGQRHLFNFVMASKSHIALSEFESFIETIEVRQDDF